MLELELVLFNFAFLIILCDDIFLVCDLHEEIVLALLLLILKILKILFFLNEKLIFKFTILEFVLVLKMIHF